MVCKWYLQWFTNLFGGNLLNFSKENFKQIFETAMDSPVSVVEANLVMEDVETRAIETFLHPPPPDFGYATLMTHLQLSRKNS